MPRGRNDKERTMSETNDSARKSNAIDCPDDFSVEGAEGGSEESAEASARAANEADLKDGRNSDASVEPDGADDAPPPEARGI